MKLKSIRQVDDCVQQCLNISGKEHLYYTDEKIITHNCIIDSQPLDSLVLMSDNTFKKIKDVNPGDKVLTPSEGIQTVISKTEPTLQKCFELEFEDGRKVRCSPNHLWKVSFRKDKYGNKIWEVVTLQFIIYHPEIDFDFYDIMASEDSTL